MHNKKTPIAQFNDYQNHYSLLAINTVSFYKMKEFNVSGFYFLTFHK